MTPPNNKDVSPNVVVVTESIVDLEATTAQTPNSTSNSAKFPIADRYILGDEIARGGMGEVYRATDTILGREVAVKVLQSKYSSNSTVADRFYDEARITGQLQHPGIPPVHDLGTLPDGRPCMAMKLIRGKTLDELLKVRPDPSAEQAKFVAVFEQIAQAVAYAHAHGVIHRDLKPANVMVGGFGEVQVMDWGLAKILTSREEIDESSIPKGESAETEIKSLRDQSAEYTQAGSVLGTPAFMPPEQALGAISKIDSRSDVFGLGAILATILTGDPPFVGKSAEKTLVKAAQADVSECFAKLEKSGSDPDLIALCKRCLSPKQDDRPATADDVAIAVAELRIASVEQARKLELDLVKAEAEKAKIEATTIELRKRRRAQRAFAGAVTVLIIFGCGAIWWRFHLAQLAEERRDRNAEVVSGLLDRCEEALNVNDPDKASVALDAADSRIADGEDETLRIRQERLRADLALVRDLDIADSLCWTSTNNRHSTNKEDADRYLTILVNHHFSPDYQNRDATLRALETSTVRERVIGTYDSVLRIQRSQIVREFLNYFDSDPYRDAVRNAMISGDDQAIATLASQTTAERQPPRFVVELSRCSSVSGKRERELLTSAIRRFPSNLWLLMSMSQAYRFEDRDSAPEKIRWLQAALTISPKNTTILNNIGVVLANMDDYEGALAIHRDALQYDPRSVDNLVNHGRVQSLLNNHTEAISNLRAAIHISSEPICWLNLGIALKAKGDLKGAIAAYREAIRIDPKYAYAYINLGSVLDDLKDYDGAIAAYREAIRIDPKEANAYLNLGSVLDDLKDYDGAIAAYRQAIHVNPKYAHAHLNLAVTLKTKGDLDGAIAAYRQAIRIDPKYAKAHSNLGLAFEAKGNLDGAIAAYREAIRIDPKFVDAHVNLGSALVDLKDLDGAIAAYREAIRIDPKYAKAHSNLGLAFEAKGNLDGAIAAYREAIRIDPKFVDAHVNLGSVLDDLKDYDGAIAAYRQAIHFNPKDASTHFNLGLTLKAKGDLDGAIAAYREAIRIDPKYSKAHSNLGNVLKTKGDLDGAIAAYRQAIQIDLKFAMAHFNLGLALKAKGDLKGAIAAYRQAIQNDPKYADAHFYLGVALIDLKDVDGAIAAYRQTIEIDPKYANAHENLAWLLAVGPNRIRNSTEAIKHALEACVLRNWKDHTKLDTLAAAYAASGDFDKAIVYQKKAIDPAKKESSSQDEFQKRLDLYLLKKPYQDPKYAPSEAFTPPRVVK